ncbi:hypothetical protein HYX07_04070 [Candidatus Woesearchaeota archaeon]|nr:hypothetical protein [Candidatus Woesearchaeota archaeon]
MSERIIFDSKSPQFRPEELEKRPATIKSAGFCSNIPGAIAKIDVDDNSGRDKPITLDSLMGLTGAKLALACMTLKEMAGQPVSAYYKDEQLVGISYPC